MKLTIDTKSFVDAVSWVTKSYDSKNDQAYVALVINPTDPTTGTYLFHLNQSSFMKSSFQVLDSKFTKDEQDEKTLTVPLDGAYLKRLASVLGSTKASIEISKDFKKKDSVLEVSTPNGKFSVAAFVKAVDAEPKTTDLGEVDNHEFFDALQRLTKLCDPVNSGHMPTLGAVDLLMNTDDKKITMMATDRYALGEITVDFNPTDAADAYIEKYGNILLPVENAVLIAPTKGVLSSTTVVYDEESLKFGYRFDDGREALFSLKEVDPLSYKALKESISSKIKHKFIVEVKELVSAINMIAALNPSEDKIYLDLSEDSITVGDEGRGNKLNVEITDGSFENSEETFVFDRSVLKEAFSPLNSTKFNFKWDTSKSPLVFEPVYDDGEAGENIFVFLMPSPA